MTQKWKPNNYVVKCFRLRFSFKYRMPSPFFLSLLSAHTYTSKPPSHTHAHLICPFSILHISPHPPSRLQNDAASILNTSLFLSLSLCLHHESPGYFHCAEERREVLWFSECISSNVHPDTQQTLLLRTRLSGAVWFSKLAQSLLQVRLGSTVSRFHKNIQQVLGLN